MAIRFYGALIFLALVPLLHMAGPLWPLLVIVLIPLTLVGSEFLFPGLAAERSTGPRVAFRLLPLTYIPAQIAVIVWATLVVSQPDGSWFEFLSLTLSIGVLAGLFGMLAAHEAIHSHSPLDRLFGVLMLFAMSYPQFRVAHVHGHHRHAASSKDPTTARRGESYYGFVFRSVAMQFRTAWRHEEIRRARRSESLLANRVFADLALLLAGYIVVAEMLGGRAVIFLAGEGVLSIAALSLFDYVAHYGLMRSAGEPFGDQHSWNASHAVGNALLFNMGRHSDHHRHAAGPYQTLVAMPKQPELPAGYAGSMLLALIPPLWWNVMERRLRGLGQGAS